MTANRSAFTFLIVIISFLATSAQNNEKPVYGKGYLVTMNHDTIKGSFLKDNSLKNYYKLYFENESGVKKYYHPGTIAFYKKGAYLYYPRTVEYHGGFFRNRKKIRAFLQLRIDGPVKLFVLGGADSHWGSIARVFYYLEREEEITRVKEVWHGYRPQMKKYFAEDSEILAKIKSREYNYSMVPSMVREYNKIKLQRDF